MHQDFAAEPGDNDPMLARMMAAARAAGADGGSSTDSPEKFATFMARMQGAVFHDKRKLEHAAAVDFCVRHVLEIAGAYVANLDGLGQGLLRVVDMAEFASAFPGMPPPTGADKVACTWCTRARFDAHSGLEPLNLQVVRAAHANDMVFTPAIGGRFFLVVARGALPDMRAALTKLAMDGDKTAAAAELARIVRRCATFEPDAS